jgi:hypothetical protein
MTIMKFICGALICLLALQGEAQSTSSPPPVKKHHFAFYGGVGPNYYFNNLVIGKQNVNSFNYSFAGRFMWEPGHLLSVGIESGYYRLYTVTASQPVEAHVSNSAVPIQLVISMKFLKSWYANFNMGQTLLLNKAQETGHDAVNASSWSLADFAGSVGYRYRFENRVSVGAETKFFFSSSYNDMNIALLFMVGYNF